jgi:hypothetical protein
VSAVSTAGTGQLSGIAVEARRERAEIVVPPLLLFRSMSDRHIRAMLRGATAAKVLYGWQGPHLSERTYCITPRDAPAMERPLDYVIEYCELLAAAGVEPLYRESEPVF